MIFHIIYHFVEPFSFVRYLVWFSDPPHFMKSCFQDMPSKANTHSGKLLRFIFRTDFLNLSMTGISGSSCGPFGNDTIINTVFHFRDDLPGIWRVPFDYLFSGTIIVPALFIMGYVFLIKPFMSTVAKGSLLTTAWV